MRTSKLYLKRFAGGAVLLGSCISIGGCASSSVTSEPAGVAAESAEISGSYEATFTTRDGSSSQGELEISPLGTLHYWLEWRDSDSLYSGRGALVGEALQAVWGSSQSDCFAVLLDVDRDGRLAGVWFSVADRDGETSTIEAVPKDPNGDDISGVYSVSADGPDSSNLPHELRVTSLGDGYFTFLWIGANQHEGRGYFDDGAILVIASTVGSRDRDSCRASEMILADDGSLSWTWLIDD